MAAGSGWGPRVDATDVAAFLVPAGATTVGLELFGTGLAFSASAMGRVLTLGWVFVGAVLAALVAGGARGAGLASPIVSVLRLGLALLLMGGSYLYWVAYPPPPIARLERLCTPGSAPDARSFRTVALELLATDAVEPAHLLALAQYRRRTLSEPASGLFAAYLERIGWTSWVPLEAALAELARIVDAGPQGEDPTARHRRTSQVFRSRFHLDPAQPWPEGARTREELSRLGASLGAGATLVASRVLGALASRPASWNEPAFHVVAARALLILGRGEDAGVEIDVHECLTADPVPRELADSLKQRAAANIDAASQTAGAGQVTRAVERMLEAWLTSPDVARTTAPPMARTVEGWLDRQLETLKRGRTEDRLGACLAGDDEQQVARVDAGRRRLRLARGLARIGRYSHAVLVLEGIQPWTQDAYMQFVVSQLRAAWRRRADG